MLSFISRNWFSVYEILIFVLKSQKIDSISYIFGIKFYMFLYETSKASLDTTHCNSINFQLELFLTYKNIYQNKITNLMKNCQIKLKINSKFWVKRFLEHFGTYYLVCKSKTFTVKSSINFFLIKNFWKNL